MKIFQNDWANLLADEMEKPYYLKLREFLQKEYFSTQIYPDMYSIFNALHYTSYQDVKVVDRTGAGDAFGSGFLSQWAQAKTLKESIIFASANSTSVVTKIGAKKGILHAHTKLHEMPLTEKAL